VGTIAVALQLGPGLQVGAVTYQISGNGFQKSDSIDVSQSTSLVARVGGIPAGTQYQLALSATATDPQAPSLPGVPCMGSAAFDVVARQTTMVSVDLRCTPQAKTGSVLINGRLNVCPVIESTGASPAEVTIGGTVALSALVQDLDGVPSPVSYSWSASSGTLSNAAAPGPTFTCTTAGPSLVTLSVSDGDCGDVMSLTVTCSTAPSLALGDFAGSVQKVFSLGPPQTPRVFVDLSSNDPLYAVAQALGPYLNRQVLCPGCQLVNSFGGDEPISRGHAAVLLVSILLAQGKVALDTTAQTDAALANVGDAATLSPVTRQFLATALDQGVLTLIGNQLAPRADLAPADGAAMLSGVSTKFGLGAP
jgi:hypothetical protein